MSRVTKMVNIADFRCLSRKILKTCRCEPIPLTKLDANKVRPLNEHLDQWDFYNRETLIQKQRQDEQQAKMRSNLKAHSKFTMNPLPDYTHILKKNKDDKNIKLNEDAKRRNTDDSNRKSDSNKRVRHASQRESDTSQLESDFHKRCSEALKRESELKKHGRESGRRGSDSSKSVGSARRRRSSSRRHRSNSRTRSASRKKAGKPGVSGTWNNPLGKTLEYLTTEEYKRISPEFLKMLQARQLAKRPSMSKYRARWKDNMFANIPSSDKDPLDTLSPTLAQYLREQMEGGNIMNKIYGIDFYKKNKNEDSFMNSFNNNPYDAMNLNELKKVLKTLKSGGTLTKDQLQFLYTFLQSAAEMDGDSFENVMRFSINLGIFTPKMVDYLKALMMKTNANLTPDNLNSVLTALGAPQESIDLPKFIRKTRVFSQRTNDDDADALRRHRQREDNAEEPVKRKKGYIYPTFIKKSSTNESFAREVEPEKIFKFGNRSNKKDDYANFRIDRSQALSRGHPPGYYEPVAVDEFVLAGLSEFQRLSTAPRPSTLAKLSEMQRHGHSPQRVKPKPRNSLEIKTKAKRASTASQSRNGKDV